jgi:pre-rRNA-processing protein IPI3
VVTTSSGQDGYVYVWQLGSGSLLHTFRTGGLGVSKNGLSLGARGKSSIAMAMQGRAAIYGFGWQRETAERKSNVGAPSACLALSPCGSFIVQGDAQGRLFLWQVGSGVLLSVVSSAHFKRIGVLRFTGDSQFLLSGGDDSLVNVWLLSSLVCVAPSSSSGDSTSGRSSDEAKPWRAFSSHSLPISGIDVTIGSGISARVLSASLDHTCKLWQLATGQLLCSILFPSAPLCCALDATETTAFAGTNSGTVYSVDLLTTSSSSSSSSMQAFVGHKKAVVGVCVSLDGSTLVSASMDGVARVFDVATQRTLRTFERHKASLTNVALLLRPIQLGGLSAKQRQRGASSSTAPIFGTLQKHHASVAPAHLHTLLHRFDSAVVEENRAVDADQQQQQQPAESSVGPESLCDRVAKQQKIIAKLRAKNDVLQRQNERLYEAAQVQ